MNTSFACSGSRSVPSVTVSKALFARSALSGLASSRSVDLLRLAESLESTLRAADLCFGASVGMHGNHWGVRRGYAEMHIGCVQYCAGSEVAFLGGPGSARVPLLHVQHGGQGDVIHGGVHHG